MEARPTCRWHRGAEAGDVMWDGGGRVGHGGLCDFISVRSVGIAHRRLHCLERPPCRHPVYQRPLRHLNLSLPSLSFHVARLRFDRADVGVVRRLTTTRGGAPCQPLSAPDRDGVRLPRLRVRCPPPRMCAGLRRAWSGAGCESAFSSKNGPPQRACVHVRLRTPRPRRHRR